MRKLTNIFTCGIIAFVAVSCTKTKKTTPTTPTTTNSNTPSPTISNVDGGLISLHTAVTTIAAGTPFTVTTETGIATFFTAPGNNTTFTDGGAVSVNSNTLDKQTNNSYLKTASPGLTPADLGFDGGSNWSVGGAGSVPAFTYNHTVAFPDFTGTMPESVTRSAGITVSLSGNVTNADSVILFIASGSTSITRTFAGSASSATISAADLASLPAVSNSSAILEVVPYRITLVTQGSKRYAFVKEYASVKNININ